MAWPQVEQRCVSGLRLRYEASLSGRLLGGGSGGRGSLCGSFAKRCGGFAALFRLGSSTGGGSNNSRLFGFVLLGCLIRVLVARVIPLDPVFAQISPP